MAIDIDKDRLQDIPQNFYCDYPKKSLSWNSVYPYSRMVSYDLLLFMLKIEILERREWSHCFDSVLLIDRPYMFILMQI